FSRDWSSDVCSSDLGRAATRRGLHLSLRPRVGSTDQVLSQIEAYRKLGIRAFIFSGYPHLDEADVFLGSPQRCPEIGRIVLAERSEERRVGEEGRAR